MKPTFTNSPINVLVALAALLLAACDGGDSVPGMNTGNDQSAGSSNSDTDSSANAESDMSPQEDDTGGDDVEPDSSDNGVQSNPEPSNSQTQGELPPTDTSALPTPVETSQQPVGDSSDTPALEGVWDYSRQVEDGFDIAYFAIDANGSVTEYDFQQDVVGSGENCYLIQGTRIVARGSDQYDIENSSSLPGSSGSEDVVIIVSDGQITFQYLGTVFDPEFGSTLTGISESYPMAQNFDVTQANTCDV